MTPLLRPVLASLVLAMAGCGVRNPSTLEECGEVGDEGARNECYARFLPERFRQDADEAATMVESLITDVEIRDFVYLTVTRTVDPGTYRWCERIQADAIEARCRVLVSRPHLHRELVGAPPKKGRDAGAPPEGGLPGEPGTKDP